MSTFNGTMEVPMPMGRPKPPLLLRPDESEQLCSVVASRTLPHGLVRRARIILLSASGMSNQAIAARLHLNPVTVSYWRKRFLHEGLQGLHGELRPGRPCSISDERVAALIRKTLRAGPTMPRTGVAVRWPHKRASPRPRFTASGARLVSSRIGSVIFNSPPILSLSKRCAISWDCI